VKPALVHDYLVQGIRGAERVVDVLHEMYPDAPMFTLMYDPDRMEDRLREWDIRPSMLQDIPGALSLYKKLYFLMPMAMDRLPLEEFDLVISSSCGWSKSAPQGEDALHVAYCYSPARFLWFWADEYIDSLKINALAKAVVKATLPPLRDWDRRTAQRPQHMIAISETTFGRMRDAYQREPDTIIYPPAGGPVVRHPEVENDIQRLYDAVLAAGGLTLTQHPTWDLTGHPVEVGVEVTTGWGIYIRDPARVHQALDEGHRFAFVGNGDSHRRNPGLCGGLTAIYAEALTAEAVLDALRNRRVYATNGSRIAVESWANEAFMGQETRSADGNVEIRLSVVATKPIVTATLIRDGEEIRTIEGDGTRNLSAVHHDADLAPGTHWYYWRIAQQGTSPNYPGNVKVARGHLAWSTPHWVTVE